MINAKGNGSRRGLAVMLWLVAASLSNHAVAADRELTESADFRVRVQAALRLGRSADPSARQDLEAGLHDSHPAVRVACAVALGSMGNEAAKPALVRAVRSETVPSVKASMEQAIAKLATSDAPGVERAKYVVQLGTVRNSTGQRSDLDGLMRSAARAKATTIKGALVVDAPDSALLERASARKIPVLLLDVSLSRLSQSVAKDGGVIVSAQVDLSIRKVPQQTLKGTVSGSASASNDARPSSKGITELQNRAVNGAVESAVSSVGSEIAALAK